MINPTLVIGNNFPIDTSGISFNAPSFEFLGDKSSMVIWKVDNPTKLEIEAFNYNSIKIGITRYKKIAFFCIKQDSFAEGDSAFHYNFTNLKDKHIMKPKDDVGLPVYICLVDKKNILRALRCVNLNKAVTDNIANIIEYQRTKEGMIKTSQEFISLIQVAYKKYNETEDMMKIAESTCEFKGKTLNGK